MKLLKLKRQALILEFFNISKASSRLRSELQSELKKGYQSIRMAEMLDGTDTIYGVTHDHYSGEFNAKSYIYKGTIYNPTSGTAGDDFELFFVLLCRTFKKPIIA